MQKLQLTIPEPCHENWQQMTPTDQGRFCNACAKEVVDFSMMTDTEVLNYFTTLTHEKVCGRALPSQLDRNITRSKEPKKRLFWYWNYIVMFFMFFGKGNTAKAQGGIKRITEQSPVKTNAIRGQLLKTGELKNEASRVITGKVTDIDGTPISFASVKIKGTSSGVSADANGAYSIRVKDNTILIISGATFKPAVVIVGSQNVIFSQLEKDGQIETLITVVAGGMIGRNLDYSFPGRRKAVATLKVKDEETGKYLSKASVVINSDSLIDTVFTNSKGIYKIKGIENYDRYFIQVKADGYESNEFTISETDFKDRKKEWEILLRKQKVEITMPIEAGKPEVITKAFCVKRNSEEYKSLYVVDGVMMLNGTDINPDDIDSISILQAPQATALYGSDGINGAIVITTRKAKEMNLKEVVIVSDFGVKKVAGMLGMVSVAGIKINRANDKIDSDAISDNQIKIYPNPVQRGNTFNLSLNLKQTGTYQIQITDATGRVVLQKQINVLTKEFTEKIITDEGWSSGVYYISITDRKNQLINKSSFIFQ